MMNRKNHTGRLFFLGLIILLFLATIAVYIDYHPDHKEHHECAVCFAARVFSGFISAPASLIAVFYIFFFRVLPDKPLVQQWPVASPCIPRSPPLSLLFSE